MMASTFHLTIITPERTFFEGEVSFAEFMTEEGRVGIFPGHEALTLILAPGVLLIRDENGSRKAAMHKGFAEILPDRVTVIAQIAEWPEEIDRNRAEEDRIKAERALTEEGATVKDEIRLRRAIARIEASK
jgi:F-type H+-transporting ATPase subunit epsilon